MKENPAINSIGAAAEMTLDIIRGHSEINNAYLWFIYGILIGLEMRDKD